MLLGGPVGALVVQSLLVGRGRAGRDRWHLGRLVRGSEQVSVGWGAVVGVRRVMMAFGFRE